MTTNQTIDGVPRELLERLSGPFTGGKHRIGVEALHELRALLDAKPVMCHGCMGDGVSHDHFDSAGKCKVAQHQGEPVAEVYRGPVSGISRIRWIDYKTAPVGTKLYAEQPAPVAVGMPDILAYDPDKHSGYVKAEQHTPAAIYQAEFLGEGGGGWSDVEHAEYLSLRSSPEFRLRTVYAEQAPEPKL